MLSRQELYASAMRTVCARRQEARARAQEARTAAEAAIPGLQQAETAFREAGIRTAMTAAQGGDVAAAQAQLHECRSRIEALLRQSGRAPNALEPKFTCPICQDTGSDGGRTCRCVQALMRGMRREEIEAASSLSIASFDSMKADYYPDVQDPITKQNVRAYMRALLGDLREYAETFGPDSANLLLIGNAGLGKTHAALAIAGTVLEKGYDVLYLSSPDLFSRLEGYHFGSMAGSEEDLMSAVRETDLLILDDLGTEMVSPFVISVFYTLLNDRMASRRATIFTSNITDDNVLEKRYTEKIASRLAGSCEPFVFLGTDIRLLKAQEG